MDPHDAAVKTPVEGSHDAAVTSAQRRDLGLCAVAVLAAIGVWTLVARGAGLDLGYAVCYGMSVGIAT